MPRLVQAGLSKSEMKVAISNGDVEGGGAGRGPSLAFENVNFDVGDKSILKNVSGSVEGGSVCAIFGPSGAGKSSLLNVLAGRSSSRGKNKVSAHVEVGGMVVDPVAFRRNVAYVMQDDALVPTATPREALRFSASLRLNKVSAEDVEKRVNKLLGPDALNLEKCADTYIGGEMIKGISGGQRKRVSVGVELVTNPKLVFLDEPTSGLDSDSAMGMVKLLRSVATRDGATVLCTIHQPSSEIFELFDCVLLLKEGEIMYQGPRENVVPYFAQRGFQSPPNYNPADYIMTTATVPSMEALKKAGFFEHQKAKPSSSGNLQALSPSSGKARKGSAVSGTTLQTIEASMSKQLRFLLARELQQNYRDVGALVGRFGITIFLNLLFGLIFAGAGGRDSAKPDALPSHFGAMVMVTIGSMFGTAQPVMLNFPMERPIFLREYTTGTYSTFAYFISKGVVEVPLAFLQNLVAYALVHPMLDLQGDFLSLVGAAWALGIASSSVAVVLGCSVPDVKTVSELAPAVFVPQMLFAGFFVRIDQIPIYLRWVQVGEKKKREGVERWQAKRAVESSRGVSLLLGVVFVPFCGCKALLLLCCCPLSEPKKEMHI